MNTTFPDDERDLVGSEAELLIREVILTQLEHARAAQPRTSERIAGLAREPARQQPRGKAVASTRLRQLSSLRVSRLSPWGVCWAASGQCLLCGRKVVVLV